MKKKSRLEANRELVKILSELVETHTDMRFGQMLSNYDFVKRLYEVDTKEPIVSIVEYKSTTWENEFYLESVNLLDRVKVNFDERFR